MDRFPTAAERARRERLIELLDEHLVMVHLDARVEGVRVPEVHAQSPALALNLSRRFGLEIFELGPLTVRASLAFGDERFTCEVPYAAIWALSTREEGLVAFFPDSAPPEVLEGLKREAEITDAEPSEETEEPDPDPGGPPFLRLVK